MPFFEASDGERLWYDLYGRPGKPWVVCLHGFTQTGRTWKPLADNLADSYRILAVDLYGHGQSSTPHHARRLGWDPTIADLMQLMGALGGLSWALVGYSMGGRLALQWALQHPGRLWAVILESATPGIADPQERRNRKRQDDALALRLEQQGLSRFVDFWESQSLFSSHQRVSPSRRESLRQERLGQSAWGLAQSLRGAGTGRQSSGWDELDGLKIPVLAVAGLLDPKYTMIARVMCNRLPQAELALIDQSGHTPHWEQPAVFLDVVQRFLAQHAPQNV